MIKAAKVVSEERARIVAWLRIQARGYQNRYMTTDPALPYCRNELALASEYAERFADSIEQENEIFSVCETLLEASCRRHEAFIEDVPSQ